MQIALLRGNQGDRFAQESRRSKMYYRVAIQVDHLPYWQWRSTVLTALDALFQFLRLYRSLPQDRLRVFSSSSREELDELLARENNGGGFGSATAAQFLKERRIGVCETTRRAAEHGEGEDQVMGSIAVSTLAVSNGTSPLNALRDASSMSALERRRLELEPGAGGDHDCPYRFTLPGSIPQMLAWVKLLAKISAGEIES
jgi:hypothetical protein